MKAGKATFKHRKDIRCILLNKSTMPKVKHTSKLQLRIDPGAKHTGIAVTREHPDGSRTVMLVLEL